MVAVGVLANYSLVLVWLPPSFFSSLHLLATPTCVTGLKSGVMEFSTKAPTVFAAPASLEAVYRSEVGRLGPGGHGWPEELLSLAQNDYI